MTPKVGNEFPPLIAKVLSKRFGGEIWCQCFGHGRGRDDDDANLNESLFVNYVCGIIVEEVHFDYLLSLDCYRDAPFDQGESI